MRLAFHDIPILIIKIYRFAVRDIPYVVPPFRRWQLIQRRELGCANWNHGSSLYRGRLGIGGRSREL